MKGGGSSPVSALAGVCLPEETEGGPAPDRYPVGRCWYTGHSDEPRASDAAGGAAASDWSHLHGI